MRNYQRPAKCGTEGGYYRHLRTLHEPACDDCLHAHAEATAARRVTRPPTRRRRYPTPKVACPSCGHPKSVDAETCRSCYDAARAAGTYEVVAERCQWQLVRGVWRAAA